MNIESFELLDGIDESLKIKKATTIAGLAKKIAFIIDIVSTGDSCSRACPRDKTAESCNAYHALETKEGCQRCWYDYVEKNVLPSSESEYINQLEKEHAFMLALLVDIERGIDHGDQQQIAVAIKRLRDILGTETIMKEPIKPGLVRI